MPRPPETVVRLGPAGLTPIELIVAKKLATGQKIREVAADLKLSTTFVASCLRDDRVKQKIRDHVIAHEDQMEALLVDAELEAATTLRAALSAETEAGKPNWGLRVDAALSLLDRAGKRGPIVSKVMANVSTVDQTQAMTQALRDPAVRAWIAETQPEILNQLVSALPQPSVPSMSPPNTPLLAYETPTQPPAQE